MAEGATPHEWRAETALIWTRYDDSDEWVVYNPLSADVHLLSASAHRLWTLVRLQGLRTDRLIAALAAELGASPDGEFSSVTRETLAHMDRAGLIRAVAA